MECDRNGMTSIIWNIIEWRRRLQTTWFHSHYIFCITSKLTSIFYIFFSVYDVYLWFIEIDDEQRIQEELQDLIDDNPIEEESDGSDSDSPSKKRRRSSEDDGLDDADFDLIEENLGVKVKRKVGSTNLISLHCFVIIL